MNPIEYNHNGDCLLARSMRRVRNYWPLAYSKLLAMKWEYTSVTPYGATDGKRLLLNQAGLDRISKTSDPVGHCAFLLVHESLHAMLSHGTRLAKFIDKDTANRAADYVINAMVVRRNKEVFQQTGGKNTPFPLIDNVLIDEALSGDKSAEQLYDELFKSPESKPKPKFKPDADDVADADDGADADDADAGAGAGSDDGADAGGDDESANGDKSDKSANGDKSDSDSGDAGAGDGAQSDSDILGNEWVGSGAEDTFAPQADPDAGLSKEDVEREIEECNEQIILGETLNAKAGLSGDSGLRDVGNFRSFREGMDWAEYLKQWFTARCQSGWDKPFNAPIFTSTGLISAGRQKKDVNDIAIIIDSSCSINTSILKEMLEAVQDALDTLKPDCIYLLSVDHQIREVIELRSGDHVPMTIKGGGGTRFLPAFDWVEENAPHIDGMVYLTDGEASDWSSIKEPAYPVLWLDYGRHPELYPFGERVKVSAR